MNKSAILVAIVAAPFLLAATEHEGNLYGRFNDGVYFAPSKLFKMSSPFPDTPIVSDGRQPENNNAAPVTFIDQAGRMVGVLYMENKGKTNAPRATGRATSPTGSAIRASRVSSSAACRTPRSCASEAGTIDGKPAWIAVAHVPNASPLGRRGEGQ